MWTVDQAIHMGDVNVKVALSNQKVIGLELFWEFLEAGEEVVCLYQR